jgi:CheY-like chemotaxis protein
MVPSLERFVVLLADDDPNDILLTREAFAEGGIAAQLVTVGDGEELMEYLEQSGRYSTQPSPPPPNLILLDLNMPRKDGREALRDIRQNRRFKTIPVIAFTTSESEDEVSRIYELGANSYIAKPSSFDGLVEIMTRLTHYWFRTVTLPGSGT